MRVFLAICLLIAGTLSAAAQGLGEDRRTQDDRGFLTGLLEDSLGGDGRVVRIEGFAGALSAEARMDSVTIADSQGIWLEMRDLRMAWNRAALLRGAVEIDTLSAASIRLNRLPEPAEAATPSPEAGGFSLPNLPVSVDIRTLRADRIVLGEPVLGSAAEMRLQMSAALVSGGLNVDLTAERLDGHSGVFSVVAAYDATSTEARIDLDLTEGADGIAARILDLPGRPPVSLQIAGQGPVANLLTNIQLATDGEPRLVGEVALAEAPEGTGLTLDLRGALAPLFPQKYGDFFNTDTVLQARALRSDAGAVVVETFLLDAGVSRLEGRLALTEDSRLQLAQVTGRLGRADGAPLRLPISDGQTQVQAVALDVDFDAADDNGGSASLDLRRLSGPGYAVARAQLDLVGRVADLSNPQSGFVGDVELGADGLLFEDAALQAAVGAAVTGRMSLNAAEGAAVQIENLALQGDDYGLAGALSIAGLDRDFRTDLDVALAAENLARFAALAGVDLSGAADLGIKGWVTAGGEGDLSVSGAAQSLQTGIAQADALLAGATTLDLQFTRDATGTRLPALDLANAQMTMRGQADLATGASRADLAVEVFDTGLIDPALQGPLRVTGQAQQVGETWQIGAEGTGPFNTEVEISGPVTGPSPRLQFSAGIPDLTPLVPQVRGAASLSGQLTQNSDGWRVQTRVLGPYDAVADISGTVTGAGAPDISFDVSLPDVAPLASGVSGPATASGRAYQTEAGLRVETALTGPFETSGTVSARVTGQNAPEGDFRLRLADVAEFVPGLRGVATAEGMVRTTDRGLRLETQVNGPYAARATLAGIVTGTSPSVTFEASLPDVAPLGTGLRGALSLRGSAEGQGGTWALRSDVSGPAGSTARLTGTYGASADLEITGTAPLGLAEPFLQPRALQGLARFDLRLRGQPSLQALSGVIETDGARFGDPTSGVTLQDISARVAVSGAAARLSATGQVAAGGQVSANGTINLTGGFNSDLTARLNSVRLVDEALYEVGLGGEIRVRGPLRGGALISGQIDVSEVQVQIPSSTSAGFTIVPTIVHQGAPAGVRRTLERAGLDPRGANTSGGGGNYGLDLQINAPARLFVRGRGLDAELGGRLRLTGQTDAPISSGGFELVRGRLDLLGKRFVLDEGRLALQGQFDPFIRFVATTSTAEGTASVILQGLASEPEVRFTATPEAPEDEVLAQIFFGRSASQLSAFQALQLASAVASLAGGGDGVVSNLRNQFDLDDLDVTTDEEGAVGLRLGKYLSDNVYTDVLIGDRDDAGVSLNVDLSPSVTVRGSVTSRGESSIGVFFERDY